MAETTTGMAPTWAERGVVLAHVLTHPTPTPSLHSQLLVASRVPCFLRWEYPPFLCSGSVSGSHSNSLLPLPLPLPLLLRWCVGSLFLPRAAAALGLPRSSSSSWRCKCPFQQPPPLRLSAAVEPPPDRWTSAERRAYLRRLRLRRRLFRPLGRRLPPLLLFAAPNLALLALVLVWEPLSILRRNPSSL